jgi:tetratricopeptide (TPR) repeat protein
MLPAVSDRFDQANALMKEGKNKEALAILRQAIWFDSDCGKCFSLMAGIEGNLQMFKEGVADGDIGMKLSKTPRDRAMGAYNKGYCLGGLDRHTEAVDVYNQSIEFDATYAHGYFGKGKSLYSLGFWAESKTALEKALELKPGYGAAWAYLAVDQMNLGDAKAGLVSANRAVELAPTDARSFRARTIAHYRDHNYEAMLADATRTLEIDSSWYHVHLWRGHALKLLSREDESASEYALEPDRQAVEAGLHPVRPFDMRIYNCGDDSTNIQTPDNYNIDGFNDCVRRIQEALKATSQQVGTKPTPKRSVPGLPVKRPVRK